MIRRTKLRMGVCILLICMNAAFIWGNSLLPGEISAALSSAVKGWLVAFFPGSGVGGVNGHHLLRKAAHFLEFCFLGGSLSWLGWMLSTRFSGRMLLPWLGGLLTACVDEMIQRFVPGRGPSVIDVGIDAIGAALGVLLLSLVLWIQTRISMKKLEENKK